MLVSKLVKIHSRSLIKSSYGEKTRAYCSVFTRQLRLKSVPLPSNLPQLQHKPRHRPFTLHRASAFEHLHLAPRTIDLHRLS